MTWLVCEDANAPNVNLLAYLNSTGLNYEYYLSKMPQKYANKKAKPKGVANRNRGMERLLELEDELEAVFYFADDDNAYNVRLFEEVSENSRHM